MNNEKEISLKEVFQTLSLFFVLSVVSVIMIFLKFEQGVEDFWQDRDEIVSVMENESLSEIIDLDNIKTEGEVYEFDKNQLVKEYIENEGSVQVFDKLFEAYMN